MSRRVIRRETWYELKYHNGVGTVRERFPFKRNWGEAYKAATARFGNTAHLRDDVELSLVTREVLA